LAGLVSLNQLTHQSSSLRINCDIDHWLTGVSCELSPNHNLRPAGTEINLLVIHNISLPAGEFGGGYIKQLFGNCLDCDTHPSFADLRGVEVSSHLLISRNGDISQFVPFNLRAWHAGLSTYKGQHNCNDFSIGIELEGSDDCPYTGQQYQALIAVTRVLLRQYPCLNTQRIVGHSDIAPGRKTDPGSAFDWDLYLGGL
jgi:N-acetyl-anhydromuramoyl-L-alanine amidase